MRPVIATLAVVWAAGSMVAACSSGGSSTTGTGGANAATGGQGTGGSASGGSTGNGSGGSTVSGSGGSANGSGGSNGNGSGGNSASGGSTGSGGSSSASGGSSGTGTGGSTVPTGGSSGNPDGGTGTGGSSSGDGGVPPADAGGTCTTSTGKALKFSGSVNDLLTGDLGSDLPGGNASRTIEAWANFTSSTSWKAEGSVLELGKREGSTKNMVFGIDMAGRTNDTSGKFDPYTNGFGDNDPTTVTAGVTGWHHISFAYDGSTKKFQFTFDGVAQTLPHPMGASSDMLATAAGIVTLAGSQSFGTMGWDGILDEVRIWTISRPAADIARDMKVKLKGTETGLVAYYHLDEGSGDFADDVKGTMSHRLTLCTATSTKCAAANTAKPMWVDSDIPGPFTCAP